jgi:hypothetical protein
MDLSFALRRQKRGAPTVPVTPDLSSLLSEAATRAATTATARVSTQLNIAPTPTINDPHVAIFAEGKHGALTNGRFADVPQVPITNDVTPGKER